MLISFQKKPYAVSKLNGRKTSKFAVIIDGEYRADICNVSFGKPRYKLFDLNGRDLNWDCGGKADFRRFAEIVATVELPTLEAAAAEQASERAAKDKAERERSILHQYAVPMFAMLCSIAERYRDNAALELIATIKDKILA